MSHTLQVGLKGTYHKTVAYEDTASSMGNPGADVFSTPSLLLYVEQCCVKLFDGHLPEGAGSVGISADFKHLAATPEEMTVRCMVEIVEVDRRRVRLSFAMYDEVEQIGSGFHERFIMPNMAEFSARAMKKSAESSIQ